MAESFAGRPSLLSFSFDWFRGGKIQGTNFGAQTGALSIQIRSRYESKDGSAPEVLVGFEIDIPEENFTTWTDTNIAFVLPTGAKEKIDEFQSERTKDWDSRDISKGKPQRLFDFTYTLTTADGRTAASN